MKIILWVFILSTSFKAWGNKCLETRAAIKMGASITKLVVAEVNFCKIEITKFLLEKDIVIDFIKPLVEKAKISLTLQLAGIKKLKNLVESAKKFNPKRIIFIPSKYFKTTSNYISFFKNIKEDLQVKILLPDLKTEAILGFLGVKIQYPQAKSKLLVWDISGNGSNWTMMDENLDFKVYTEKINPNIFKNLVIEGVLKKNYHQVKTPNPLGSKNAKEALDIIKLYASYNTPKKLQKIAKELKVVGIGSFHNKGIMGQLRKRGSSYNLEDLEGVLKIKVNQSDQEIIGLFPSYQVTNLILAMGSLETMELDQVFTTNTNEAHGAIMYPEF